MIALLPMRLSALHPKNGQSPRGPTCPPKGDNDNFLGKQEVGDLASDPEYSDNDSNKDGALSIEEVIEEKITDFKASDTDGDGSLTFEEVMKSYESNP